MRTIRSYRAGTHCPLPHTMVQTQYSCLVLKWPSCTKFQRISWNAVCCLPSVDVNGDKSTWFSVCWTNTKKGVPRSSNSNERYCICCLILTNGTTLRGVANSTRREARSLTPAIYSSRRPAPRWRNLWKGFSRSTGGRSASVSVWGWFLVESRVDWVASAARMPRLESGFVQ